MKFGIVEIGSTNTKAYLYDEGNLNSLGNYYIPFKNDYKSYGRLFDEDIQKLEEVIDVLKKDTKDIYCYGTSIFRNIKKEELEEFISLTNSWDVNFKVVSAEDENRYTVSGVLADIEYDKDMVVVIGGGGSTEVAFIKNKEIVEMKNLSFGAMDITDSFPDLKNDIASSLFDNILDYTCSLVGNLEMKADIMVLAGGDYLYFYETVGYEMEKNTFYKDEKQPFMIEFSKYDNYDRDILNKSLEDIKKKCVGNEKWWDGARGMRFCMNAIARKVEAKYIVPTKINMINGIVKELLENEKS